MNKKRDKNPNSPENSQEMIKYCNNYDHSSGEKCHKEQQKSIFRESLFKFEGNLKGEKRQEIEEKSPNLERKAGNMCTDLDRKGQNSNKESQNLPREPKKN